MLDKIFDVSFRCGYSDNTCTNHYQSFPLSDIPKWIDVYKFTHPLCKWVSVKIWFYSLDLESED